MAAVIVAAGSPSVNAARDATSTIPIVMPASGDPVGQGFVTSLARPGGNITGLAALSIELSGKRLELLKGSVPRASRVAVLWNPADPASRPTVDELEVAARRLQMQLQPLEWHDPGDLDGAFRAATAGRADALIVVAGGITNAHRARIVDLAQTGRLPAMYTEPEFVGAGGLMAYGPSNDEMYRHAAVP